MIEIVETIDCWFKDTYPYHKKLFGLCELMTRRDQVMPVTIKGRSQNNSEQVSLDDDYEFITWVRLDNNITVGNDIEGEDWRFGLRQGLVQSVNLRIVIAYKVTLGESLIIDIIRQLPVIFTVDGYQVVSVNKEDVSLDTNHETIYNTELGATEYEKHRFNWNIYALDIPVQFIPCAVSV